MADETSQKEGASDRPPTPYDALVTQTLVTLAVIFAASQLFVRHLEAVGPMLGLSASVTALLLSPIATELPEIMNAIIWVRPGKTPLALANISGAMMIQATVPSGLGCCSPRGGSPPHCCCRA